jgi:molybdenum cofactor cytidylyltransferase
MPKAADSTVAAGLVLAAGKSSRMGTPKPLLELEGEPFIGAAVRALREGGCRVVVAVVAGEDAADAARSAGALITEGAPDGEQIESLRQGLDALGPDIDAVVVLPVDQPRVAASTVRALLDAWRRDPTALVRPVHDGRPGHPTVFPSRSWGALRDPALTEGARSVVEAERVLDVVVNDPGVLIDIDTPEDYRRHGASPR